MVNVYLRNGKIEISTINSNEELQEDKILKGEKEFEIGNGRVKISEVVKENNFLDKLPYSNRKKLLLVEMDDMNDLQRGFNLICSEGEYFLGIEKFYFELLNDLYSSYIVESDFDEVISNFISLITPKIELFQDKKLEEDRIETRLKGSQINELLNYTDIEKEAIYNLLWSLPTLALKQLFDYSREEINSTKNKFYIIINEFSENIEKQIIENYGEMLKSDLNRSNTDKPILILVHGLASSCRLEEENYLELTEYLTPYFNVYTYDYLTINQPISASGKILAAYIKELKESYNNEVYIIAHSMGGLVSRSAIEEHKAPIDKLIMAGTPNNGSLPGKLARIEKTTLFIANHSKIKFQDFFDLIYGNVKGLEDLSRKNSYIKKLNDIKLFNHKNYYCLAGDCLRFRYVRIPNIMRTDLVVSVHNMTVVNGRKIPNVKLGNWTHFNYFTKDLEKSIGDIINFLLKERRVAVSI
ncbi:MULTISPECIES: esterase/lipase family protein [Bacillus cereus group]|uniref:esterase/lipase family protein n=1 Tax=Bacillus cereus group TaxID=86661 RepID=UPI000BF47199|nr:alpha/beta hydrolase [Bacillus cereus]KAA1804762.1 hypothetical protein FXB61_004380 [Bacillus cereus]PFA44862.1 hypothetical protein CN381_14005 [Bacillus cereus]HDR7805744.1 alpha/beta hydrolase [Bacillus cereus]HDR8028892.1 alpha/beta hydrolase [Bacillus cereus]HDR8427909.1 alpha/beta hydrolase [Bacillus cereus]